MLFANVNTHGEFKMTEKELEDLGSGTHGYIKAISSLEASRLFPEMEGLPEKGKFFSLHGADGTPLSLSDSRKKAIGNAIEGELEIVPLQ